MNASGRLGWLRPVLLVGVVNLVVWPAVTAAPAFVVALAAAAALARARPSS